MRVLFYVVAGVVLLALLGWLGLQVRPRPFPELDLPHLEAGEFVAAPSDVPLPVQRFFEGLYGDRIPVVSSAVVAGRGRMRIAGITFPARFRFTHEAGRGYRHYIELTFFGFPVVRVNEWFLEGSARLELPFGVTENEPKVDQAANLALWAEAIWFPSVFFTDPRVEWRSVDEETALLVVPFGEEAEHIVMRFDPESGLPRFSESMRYKQAHDELRSLWINEVSEWGTVDSHPVPVRAAVTWHEEGSPWAVLNVEEVVYNVDVGEYLRARGP